MKKLLPILLLAATAHAAPVFTTEQDANEIRVLADGKLFCAYVFRGAAKPYVYPLTAPDGVTLNREFPMREVAGESNDHPHHTSLWFAHADANGEDCWNFKKGSIETIGTPDVKTVDDVVEVKTRTRWVGTHSNVVALAGQVLRFGESRDGVRFIDFEITLSGDGAPLIMGDAKDGAMAMRLRDEFNFKNEDTLARNSEGDDKKTIWSKRARWVNYETQIGGKWYGVAMFNHPENPRPWPRWHARDYGLLAVNPFGEKAFDPKSGKAGGVTVEKGKSLTLRYRMIFYTGRKNASHVDNLFGAYTGI